MQIRLERVKSIGRKIASNDEKGTITTVFVALIIVIAASVGYFTYAAFQPKPASYYYSTIYLLDSQHTANSYPVTLVANQNSTFNVFFSVENHMYSNEKYQVLLKVTSNPQNFPVQIEPEQTFNFTLANNGTWQNQATITENQVGTYSVVFELWIYNSASGSYEFTNNYCVLNVQVTG